MANGKRINYSRILANNWVITLTATLIGVFVALYLNEKIASNKLFKQKEIAIDNILAEINSNKEKISPVIDVHTQLLEIMEFLGEYMDENDELIAPVDKCYAIRKKYPDIFILEDSSYVSKGVYNYDGEINLDLSFPHFELTTISLKTLKSSGILSSFDFNCLMYLETLENITNEVRINNKELFDYFIGARESGINNENMLQHIKLLIDYETTLNSIYEDGQDKLSNCM